MLLEPYVIALDRVGALCRDAASGLGIALDPISVVVEQVAAGCEEFRAVGAATVRCRVSDVAQLRPPPEGMNAVYACAHEVGHLVVAALLGPHRAAPPVVWDEALADGLACGVFLPAVWAVAGPEAWPGGWSIQGQVAIRSGVGGWGYDTLLVRQRAWLQARAEAAGSWATILTAVAAVAGRGPCTPDVWRSRLATALGPAGGGRADPR